MASEHVRQRTAEHRERLLQHEEGGLDDFHTVLERSAAHDAARANDIVTLQALADEQGGTDVLHQRDKYGLTPLHWTAERGNAGAAQYLLDNGADVNAVERRLFRRTPLHLAALAPSQETTELLLARGADVHATDYRGWTAVHCAAHAGSLATVKALVAFGADASARTAAGERAADIARQSLDADEGLVEFLLRLLDHTTTTTDVTASTPPLKQRTSMRSSSSATVVVQPVAPVDHQDEQPSAPAATSAPAS